MGAKCGTGLRAGSELSSAVSQIGRRPGHLVERLSGALGPRLRQGGLGMSGRQRPKVSERPASLQGAVLLSPQRQKELRRPTHLAKGEALAGRATEIDCQAWLGAAVSVLACDRQRIAAALGPDSTQLRGTLTLALPGGLADDRQTPGVAQLTGLPLVVGSRVEISGVASKDAGVTARAATSNALFDTRFTHLGLRNGGTAILEVLPSREGSEVPAHPPGWHLRPAGAEQKVSSDGTQRRLGRVRVGE